MQRRSLINPTISIDEPNYFTCKEYLFRNYGLSVSHAIDIAMEHILSYGPGKHKELAMFFDKYRETRNKRNPTVHEQKWQKRKQMLLDMFTEYPNGIKLVSACIRLDISAKTLDRLIYDHMDGKVYKDYIRSIISSRKKVILRLRDH